ncbi:threonine dehydrogenase-like Zn-dependent dehydrogenase [Geomicrobium halophilum]|uniref:Threonine dehydrogenase-like Zn-dependent dehydrogenase n=1 Tax=Geomicrobium halophilum TaxID=549000 RepID=A0A841Q0Q7_9BACL|nr:alcohol dehydrogenase catalytic domain-containing protein [Geomicrobium halophilum]MBB6449108.1 threonine dehydrogenase-like Zn-dependent dehydrogenase [Geomicrobium halophilum]
MESLQFDFKPSRYLISKTIGRFSKSFYWSAKTSCFRFAQLPDPELPNENWVKIKVKYGGICGSDLNIIFLNESPATSPYTSFPFTFGHESVGVIQEVGKNVDQLSAGDRVVIDPILSCTTRGITELCSACQRGDYSLCENMTDGHISPGLLTGTCRDTGGSWSSHLVAHQNQVFHLPDEVADFNGVMVEPFSCALHGVLRNPPRENDTVLVIGGGVIGICVIAALRALQFSCKVVALVKHDFQAKCAKEYGADQVIQLGGNYTKRMSEALDTKRLKTLFGPEVIEGGADLVYECVGKKQSVNDSLRFANSGGKVILLGLAGILDSIDWTAVWLNELDVKGSFAYSSDEYKGDKIRTFDIALELMRLGKVDLSPLVTHRFPIKEYRQALTTASSKANGTKMKVVFEP